MLTLRPWIAAACLTLVAGCRTPTEAAPPQEQDLWYSIGDGQQAYGHMQVLVRRLDDGGSEYVVRSLVQLELFEARNEVRTSITALVGPDLSLRHLESESEQTSGRTLIRVRATPDGLAVEREQDGTMQASTVASEAGLPVVPDVAVGEWLHRLVVAPATQPGFTRRVRILSSEAGASQDTEVRLLAVDSRGSTWALDHGQEWQETTLRLDGHGIMVEQTVSIPPLRITRASREQALAIDYRVMPDRELLVFAFDRQLPPTRRLERIDVKLTWQDIPPAEFELEDARQRLLSLEEVAGRCTAVVRLEREAGSAADAALPLPREEFAATLASDDFLLPDDERIAATAAEIVGGETSARAAATKICQWVSDHIRPAMIAETLTGPQVLERRTGKCSEYTTLFGSLARAAGIPTRVVLGQRRFAGARGDTWGGHMWNEVFVGQWIPVDASANEVGGSLDLIKFVHSDTVLGTQPLRWKLTRSLAVSIADVELRPAADDAAGSGLQGTTYTSAEHGFQVRLPDATWALEDTKATGALVLRLRPADPDLGDAAMFHVTAFSCPKGVAPKTILDARLQQQRKALDDVEVLRDEDAGIAGAASHRLTFGGVRKNRAATPLRVSEVLLVHGETGVLVNLIANAGLHEEYAAVLERIVATVSFLQ